MVYIIKSQVPHTGTDGRAVRSICSLIAETLGVSRQAVSKWERGATDPSNTNLIALAKLFGVEAEELLKEAKMS